MARLFGAPPGYVGYEEGGQLTEKVRRKPFSVVLFDEVEKAHPDIFNSLLQILEEGRLTDSQGRVVDFKNTVIIMTTNLGSRDIGKGVSLGFADAGNTVGSYDRMKAKVSEELKQHFRPEFLNRVDEIVVFPPLTQDEIIQMVDLMVGNLETRLKDKDMGIELTPAAKDLLARRGFDPVLGARPLRRTIQREIEDAVRASDEAHHPDGWWAFVVRLDATSKPGQSSQHEPQGTQPPGRRRGPDPSRRPRLRPPAGRAEGRLHLRERPDVGLRRRRAGLPDLPGELERDRRLPLLPEALPHRRPGPRRRRRRHPGRRWPAAPARRSSPSLAPIRATRG